jgi:hypothetical protein
MGPYRGKKGAPLSERPQRSYRSHPSHVPSVTWSALATLKTRPMGEEAIVGAE